MASNGVVHSGTTRANSEGTNDMTVTSNMRKIAESLGVSNEANQYPSQSDSEDEQNEATKAPNLSEKRRTQNAMFSAWSAAHTDHSS